MHARKVVLQELVNGILERGKTALSTCKTWALLARAGGVGAAGEQSGVYFVDARTGKLRPKMGYQICGLLSKTNPIPPFKE